MKTKTLLATVAFSTLSTGAFANEYESAMQEYLQNNLKSWVDAAVLVEAIKEQNAVTSAYDQAMIDNLDTKWRAEVGSGSSATVEKVLSNAAADFLRAKVEESGGSITEVFIMDARGLNVAASAPTSDMWQGDEAKFTETFPKGADAKHFSDVEMDESSQTYQAQISISITDPETGDVIGAMTVGVDAESLI